MTRDDTLHMALDLGAEMYSTDRIEFWMPAFWKFVEKVRESEREACAKVCDGMAAEYPEENPDYALCLAAEELARLILARGETK